jgi:tetratricopeptide (TPR) repeat protein
MMYNYFAVFYQYSHGLGIKLAQINSQIRFIDIQVAAMDTTAEDFAEAKQEFEAQKDSLSVQHAEILEEIINKMDRCVALMPWDERPRVFRHRFLVEQGLFDLARKRLDEALKVNPKSEFYLHLQRDLENRG